MALLPRFLPELGNALAIKTRSALALHEAFIHKLSEKLPRVVNADDSESLTRSCYAPFDRATVRGIHIEAPFPFVAQARGCAFG